MKRKKLSGLIKIISVIKERKIKLRVNSLIFSLKKQFKTGPRKIKTEVNNG
jgi:hypothetical protein